MTFRAIVFATSVFSFLLIPRASTAADWHVDASVSSSGNGSSWEEAFQTIERGIVAASSEDAVIVAQGSYVENIRFEGKNIVLRSVDPVEPSVVAATIIDGNESGPVVTFSGAEDETCLLSGFTIRNGTGAGAGIFGGESPGEHTHATIQNNVISGNSAHGELGYGAGVAFCDGIIQDNTISGNSASVGGGGLFWCDGLIEENTIENNSVPENGGGLSACNGIIRNNTIVGNSAGHGGGLAACNGIIRNNTIVGNSAGGSAGGIGSCDGTIENNTISGNSARYGGGLAYCLQGTIRSNLIIGNSADWNGGGLYSCYSTIENNTIAGNSAGLYGGGLRGCGGIIQNNTIANNSAISVGGGLYECDGTIQNCILWGNTAWTGPQLEESSIPTYSCIQGWTGGGEGNIAPPSAGFVDPDGPDDDPATYEDNNYRLAADSPCIDAGMNEAWMSEAVDLDGNPRIADGHNDGLVIVDMGAYEYPPFRIVEVAPTDGGELRLTWNSRPAESYTIWSCSDLVNGPWNEEGTIASEGRSTTWTDLNPTSTQKFYRIELK